jgi:hypothetical protein
VRFFRYVLLVSISISVVLANQSVDRAARAGYAGNSSFFWPLFPGMFVGYILNGGGHAGHVMMANIVSCLVNIGLYWIVLMFLFRKLVTRIARVNATYR